MVAMVGLKLRPATLEVADIVKAKHSSKISVVLSEMIGIGIH